MGSVLLVLQDWEAVGHGLQAAWLEFAGRFGVTTIAVAGAALLVLAFLRRHRYRAHDVLTESELAELHETIAEVERKTVGEVLPVVLERSDDHPGARWIAALLAFLTGSALLATWLPWDQPLMLVACQLVMAAVGYGLATALPDFQRRFVRESRATEMAAEQALQEFYGHKLHETEARTGVLLFVSLFEHRVIVLADEGIHAKVGDDQWVATDTAILDGLRAGSLATGLKEGIRQAGEVLAEHFPWEDGDRNEIPDRIVVRRQ